MVEMTHCYLSHFALCHHFARNVYYRLFFYNDVLQIGSYCFSNREKTNFGSNFWLALGELKRGLLPHGVNTYHVIPSYSGQLFTIRIPCRISIRCKSAHKIGHKP